MTSNPDIHLNDGNIAVVKTGISRIDMNQADESAARSIHLVIDDELLRLLDHVPSDFEVAPKSKYDTEEILKSTSTGNSLVWIGNGDGIPRDLWVKTFRPADSALSVTLPDASPLVVSALDFQPSHLSSAFISPPKEMPLHNIDEEVRADLLPIMEARDRFGQVVGYPGGLMAYHASSLVERRFEGSECFFFLFDKPAEALAPQGWTTLLESIALRFRSALQLRRVEADYASYQVGERVRIRARIANLRSRAAAVDVRFYVKTPEQDEFRCITSHRRCPDAFGESETVCDFVANGRPGLWTLRIEVCQDIDHAQELAIEGSPVPIDRRDIAVVVLECPIKTRPLLSIDGPSIRIDGDSGFWAGTHYYPSSSWWEWAWRDFRPLKAACDFSAMRRLGYRLVRIWVDPVLDEQALRAMDAAIYLASLHGIVLDICIFTQWVREIGFERPDGEIVKFDFRGKQDFNVYSVSFRNLALQREYVRVLADRWKTAGNIIYNLANEVYVKDPDRTQMGAEAAGWDGIPSDRGSLRDSLVFRRWAKELTNAIREAGGDQPVIPGYMFSLSEGGDSYLGNRDADIAPWHCYLGDLTGLTLQYFDPICTNRPIILEEFGTLGWNSQSNYDTNAHLALAAGASAAMSYEWGVSWLAPEMCFYPIPLRESIDGEPDSRSFEPYIEIGKSWPSHGVGICATPSGFGYGSIYHGTPFPGGAAVALSRLGLMGKGLDRSARPERAYVIVRTAKNDSMEAYYNTFRRLWKDKVAFGIWHEDCLDNLPDSARVLICPDGLSPESEVVLQKLNRSGIDLFTGHGWNLPPEIPRIAVNSSQGSDLLVRRTSNGTLYVLMSDQPADMVTVETEERNTVTLELSSYAMIHECGSGIALVEASGRVTVNGSHFCTIGSGRAIIASSDNTDLINSESIRLTVTHPTQIEFAKDILEISVWDELNHRLIAAIKQRGPIGSILNIDDELSRYVLVLQLAAR